MMKLAAAPVYLIMPRFLDHEVDDGSSTGKVLTS